MTDSTGLYCELEEFFVGLGAAVEAGEERHRGIEAGLHQELAVFFAGLASDVDADEERCRGLGAGRKRELDEFFCQLKRVVQTEEERNREAAAGLERDLTGLFGLLEPTVAAAAVAINVMEERAREEQDRRTGRKFSVFDLVRTQELDLSRIFAGLLNPMGDHSQGDLFLSLLLEELIAAPGGAGDRLRFFQPPGGTGTRVHLEYQTGEVVMSDGKPKQGSVDLVLEFEDNRWIGIENKPWAVDQREQVNRYLSSLDEQARRLQGGDEAQVILLYWSGDGSAPNQEGLSEEQKLRCLTVPYRTRFGVPSVEGWLKRCRAECEAERVSLFLHELLEYIGQTFARPNPNPPS